MINLLQQLLESRNYSTKQCRSEKTKPLLGQENAMTVGAPQENGVV